MGRKKAVKRKFYINNRLLNPATQSATRELIQYFGENVCETSSKSIAEPTVPPSSSAQLELQPQPPSVTSSVATVAGLGAEFGTATGTISTLGGATKYMRPELATMLGLVKQVEPITKKQPAQFTSMYQVATRSNLEGELVKNCLNPRQGKIVFRTVLPCTVNDMVLIPPMPSDLRKCPDTKSRYSFKDNKDPEPVLSDYLRPTPVTFHFVQNNSQSVLGPVAAGVSWNNFSNIVQVLKHVEPRNKMACVKMDYDEVPRMHDATAAAGGTASGSGAGRT
ncbi:uncharacterized protein LOC120901947 [Anopheles arabiensis]|uniref:Uncharacterized protein n=1 Tax=Anopheles arabiensis TaxID=7173 RepID=A0A182IBT6_ANOAR|nr:uncharacterized protein LOC120901947 [Anopheles arabiensis]